jgi:hypothetical protein
MGNTIKSLREDWEMIDDMKDWWYGGYYGWGFNEKWYYDNDTDEDEVLLEKDEKISYYIIDDIIDDD